MTAKRVSNGYGAILSIIHAAQHHKMTCIDNCNVSLFGLKLAAMLLINQCDEHERADARREIADAGCWS